ncbi:MAG: hypothetical protein D6705_10800 [Deltaproteobacteria bacterium]|nr:MAG: hypothetical protein D6705_10800 [Deltaproteobacteria bacterium]
MPNLRPRSTIAAPHHRRRSPAPWLLRGVALAVALGPSSVAIAASPASTRSAAAAAAPSKDAPAAKEGKARSGKRRIALEDEFLVEGKLEKPSAFYVLRRSSIDYDWARLDAKFVPLVLESVQDPLF